ncbi:MAG: hypothetical protein K2X82_12975, partial [Gemmataceae bacterium]|nr:hypothetical protein [Gemmataceae bacterium]
HGRSPAEIGNPAEDRIDTITRIVNDFGGTPSPLLFVDPVAVCRTRIAGTSYYRLAAARDTTGLLYFPLVLRTTPDSAIASDVYQLIPYHASILPGFRDAWY